MMMMMMMMIHIFQETTDRLSRPYSDCIPIEERDIGRNVFSEIYPVEYRVKVNISIVLKYAHLI